MVKATEQDKKIAAYIVLGIMLAIFAYLIFKAETKPQWQVEYDQMEKTERRKAALEVYPPENEEENEKYQYLRDKYGIECMPDPSSDKVGKDTPVVCKYTR